MTTNDPTLVQDLLPPTISRYKGFIINPKRKLTPEQKRIAELVHLGYTRKELAQKFNLPFGKLTAWSKNPRYQRYIAHLDRDADASVTKKARALLDQAFRTLEKMLKSGHFPSEQFAVETVFRLNGRGSDQPNGNGNGVSVNLVQQSVDLGSLDPVKKEKVKELLSITRDARPVLPPPQ